ncbi:MAG TPA: transglutaminase family protein [Sporichthyaceae bacterium]|nr:transglutaminase family protein [Sporichthyaceae bacterium]
MSTPVSISVPPDARRYQLTHRTEYGYDEDVLTSYGRAHLIPRHGEGQYRLEYAVDTDPGPADFSEHTDFFGNRSVYFVVREPHRELTVTARSVVAVDRPGVDREALRDVRARTLRDRLADRSDLDPDLLDARPFLLPSPRIGRAPEVGEFAADLMRPGRSLDEVLVDLLERIGEFAYVAGVTTVSTPLAELLTRREGVCQDFAHLGVAALRAIGLAARYVSGYLETRPPPGRPRLIGADASHAWVSVFAPGLGWVDLDPTNHQFVDDSYVVAAIGRDYGDVAPLRGVIFTESTQSTLDVSVDMTPLDGPGVDTAVAG